MNDDIKDLLTLAAKACGYEVSHFSPESGGYVLLYGEQDIWRPGLDDGDNARMEEAAGGIDVTWFRLCVTSGMRHGPNIREFYRDHNNDRQAARRWASLRVAAQIGKGMK